MSLNKEQRDLFDYLNEIMQNRLINTHLITVSSPAGTGKTHFIRKFVTEFPSNIQILAPTHKSCSLFKGVSAPVSTIHRFFNASSDYNDNGELLFTMDVNENVMNNGGVLIIDEASMVSEHMLVNFLKLRNKNKLRAIIFFGDDAQLPPVNERTSMVFEIPGTILFKFTQCMRSNNSMVTRYNELFRNSTTTVPVEIMDRNDALVLFKESKDAIILCWTNQAKDEWNEKVRWYLFGTDADEIQHNEKMVFSGYRPDVINIKHKSCFSNYVMSILEQLPIKSHGQYHSSDIISVVKPVVITLKTSYFRCEHSDTDGSCDICDMGSDECGEMEIKLFSFKDKKESEWLFPMIEDSEKVLSILSRCKKYIQRKKASDRKIFWKSYYLLSNTISPNLSYAYASTIHKAQGSQWLDVFVFINNLKRAPDSKKLMYTAVSRAIDNVMFV